MVESGIGIEVALGMAFSRDETASEKVRAAKLDGESQVRRLCISFVRIQARGKFGGVWRGRHKTHVDFVF